MASRTAELNFHSNKVYADPFNAVDVDVIFEREGLTSRVPAFWKGGSEWAVRFTPSIPGRYRYHLESTDRDNADLNGRDGEIVIDPYSGINPLLGRGALRVSANKRHFEHADGTPFYWLGDTWWSGLSTRLDWEGFQALTADRKAKGFTVVQMVAGLVPLEEQAPSDPGYCNEGGYVWDAGFKTINPQYFDYADRRIAHLIEAGIIPAIVGAWSEKLALMGVERLKKHWRYVIARYSAYPVFWIAGGEVFDPPEDIAREWATIFPVDLKTLGQWTEIARYVRATDPSHHPIAVHEKGAACDLPLQDENLTDFQLFQPAHYGWPSIAIEIVQLNSHYARTAVTKPLVVGEIGYEGLGEAHLEDFQRAAFWLGMLNGAAGYSYGANGVWESYTNDKPFQRLKWSLVTWREGMNFRGSYQIGLASKLLRQYPWEKFAPHPEWVTPGGTTLLEPREGVNRFHVDAISSDIGSPFGPLELPEGEWKKRGGNLRQAYAAGVAGVVRIIYMPYFGFGNPEPPTILGLEPVVAYRAFYWEPSLGVRFDLGTISRPPVGTAVVEDMVEGRTRLHWVEYQYTETGDAAIGGQKFLTIVDGVEEANVVVAVNVEGSSDVGLALRFGDADNFLGAMYSPEKEKLEIFERKNGLTGKSIISVATPGLGTSKRITAEVNGSWAAVSISDGKRSYTSRIVRVTMLDSGGVGLMRGNGSVEQSFARFALSKTSERDGDEQLDRSLHDAEGEFRGELKGSSLPILKDLGISTWDDFGREKILLLDAYRPDRVPYGRDWILVLERVPEGNDSALVAAI